MKIKYNNISFFVNYFFNFASTAFPLVFLQFFIYPNLLVQVGTQDFGVYILILSAILLFSEPLGSALNQARLVISIRDKKLDSRFNFDFLLILFIFLPFAILLPIGYINFSIVGINLLNTLLISIIVLLLILKSYLISEFKVNLDYKKIFVGNLFFVLGFFFGYMFLDFFIFPIYIYFFGSLFSFVYIFINTSYWKTNFKISPFFFDHFKKVIGILGTVVIVYAFSYVDKILISSIYSSSDLSFYYTANAFGKILLTALGPLSGLILSYLVGYRKIETASFIKILVILFVISIPGFFVSYYLSDFFIFYFYKSIYVQTKSLLFFATISSIISFFIIMINPFVIKFKSLRMLFLVNFFSFIFSLFFSIYLGSLYNILGFTIGIAFSNFIRLILTIILFIFF